MTGISGSLHAIIFVYGFCHAPRDKRSGYLFVLFVITIISQLVFINFLNEQYSKQQRFNSFHEYDMEKKKSICLLLELTHAKYNDESQNVIICLLHGKRKASHDIWLQSIVSKGTHRDMWLIINT